MQAVLLALLQKRLGITNKNNTMKNQLKSWLIAVLIAAVSGTYIYAQINSVTGVGQGTDWPPFTADIAKKPHVLKRFVAGTHRTLPTPVPATGADGMHGWAQYIGTGNFHIISSDGATKGVRLFVGDQGDQVVLINSSATASNLYPADGGKINGGVANNGVIIPASKGVMAICTIANNWWIFDLPARATAAVTPTATPSATATASPTATLVPTPSP